MLIVQVVVRAIEFNQCDHLHTIAYARDVQKWMESWTVGNNFTPVCIAFDDSKVDFIPSEDKEAGIYAAMDTLIRVHINRMHDVMSRHMSQEREYERDFKFSFTVYEGASGTPLVYKGNRNAG